MAIAIAGFTGPSGYGAAGTKPTVSAVPGIIFIACCHFYDSTSTATLSGFTTARAGQAGGGGSGGTVATALWQYYADLSAAPATYAPTISGTGGDRIVCVYAITGVDSTTPVPAGGTSTAVNATGGTTLSISGATVSTTDSIAILACAAWNNSIWSASSPSGWTRSSGSSSSEGGAYYTTSPQAIGTSIGASFSGSTGANEEAAVLVVFSPSSGGTVVSNIDDAYRRNVRLNSNYRR